MVLHKGMYINLLVGGELGEVYEVFRLNLGLYGTKQTGRLWGMKLDKGLKAKGAVRSKVDPCLYTWSHPVHGLVYVLVYVGDFLVAGMSLDWVQAVNNSAPATFDVRDMGGLKDFVGVKVRAFPPMSGQRHIGHTLQKRVSNSPLASSRGG